MALTMWKAMENEEISIHRMSLAKKSIETSYMEMVDLDQELGIQKQLATMICKMIFENDVAELTLEIADENVLQVEKDVSVTFFEMLGTIGKSLKDLQYLQWVHIIFFRGQYWLVHWLKFHQCHRNSLLDLQDDQTLPTPKKSNL